MWILPKQLRTSLCVADTEALTSDSVAASKTCAQSLIVRSKQPHANYFLRAWKAGNLTRLRSGVISSPFLGGLFTAKWTSFLADIPASHSAQPESEQEKTIPGTFGPGLQMELLPCSLDFASSRTSKATSRWDSPASSAIWKSWVTERRGAYSRRRNASMQVDAQHHTSGSACLSWPTVRTSDCQNSPKSEQFGKRYAQLRSAINWPTATSRDWKGAYSKESHSKKNRMSLLPDMVAHWPTPTAAEAGKIGNQANHGQLGLSNHPALRSEVTREKLEKSRSGQAAPASPSTHGSRQESWATPIVGDSHLASSPEAAQKRIEEGKVTLSCQNPGKLNPRWVETLMGLPVGWTMPSCASPVTIAPTSCGCSVTELCPQPQK